MRRLVGVGCGGTADASISQRRHREATDALVKSRRALLRAAWDIVFSAARSGHRLRRAAGKPRRNVEQFIDRIFENAMLGMPPQYNANAGASGSELTRRPAVAPAARGAVIDTRACSEFTITRRSQETMQHTARDDVDAVRRRIVGSMSGDLRPMSQRPSTSSSWCSVPIATLTSCRPRQIANKGTPRSIEWRISGRVVASRADRVPCRPGSGARHNDGARLRAAGQPPSVDQSVEVARPARSSSNSGPTAESGSAGRRRHGLPPDVFFANRGCQPRRPRSGDRP